MPALSFCSTKMMARHGGACSASLTEKLSRGGDELRVAKQNKIC